MSSLKLSHKVFGTLSGFAILFMDRLSYYGFRVVLTLYLIQEYQLTDIEAATFYIGLSTLTYLASVPGGLIADLLTGQRVMVIFCSVFAGILLLMSTMFGVETFKFCIMAAAVLFGMMRPCQWTLIARLHPENDPIRNVSFLGAYIALNGGALVAVTAISDISAQEGLKIALIISGIAALICGALTAGLWMTFKNEYASLSRIESLERIVTPIRELLRIPQLGLIIVAFFIFWAGFELVNNGLFDWLHSQEELRIGSLIIQSSSSTFFNFHFVMALCVLGITLSIFWKVLRIPSLLGSWGVMAIIVSTVVILSVLYWFQFKSAFTVFLMFFVFSVLEVAVGLYGLSVISSLAPKRFLSTTLGIAFIPFALIRFGIDAVNRSRLDPESTAVWSFVVLGVFGLIYLCFDLIRRTGNSSNDPQTQSI